MKRLDILWGYGDWSIAVWFWLWVGWVVSFFFTVFYAWVEYLSIVLLAGAIFWTFLVYREI